MAEDIQSNIRINVDTAAALANIKNLQGSLSAFYSQMAKSGAAANATVSGMQQNFINSVNMSGKFAASIQTIKSSTESFNTALEKNKFSLGEYFKYGVAASKSFGKTFKTEYETINKVAIERVKDLQTQYIKMGRDANGALRSIAIRPLALDLENLGTKTQIAAQRQQILNQLLKQGSTNLLNWGKNTQWAGRQLMVGFSIPIAMAGAAAAKAYQQIEEGSVKIRRVYGDMNTTAQETDAMVGKIQNLAAAYTKYGVAVADTMKMAADAAAMGKTGADLLAQIDQATKLSVLGGVDQQQALQTTISLTNAFGISTAQLSDKINYLNSVENQTSLSIEDMTTAIPKAAPIVKQLGGSVEDLAYFLTAMKEGGVNAAEGANAIKSGMASLINPTKSASDFLKGFGIDVAGIVQKDKGNLKQTVLDFAKSLDTLDPLNRAKAIEMMFGKFQFSRMSTMLQNITKEGSQASKAMELANMSAIERAAMSRKELDKIQSSPMYKFQKALADFQLKLAPVGEAFLKAITPVVETIGKALTFFNKLSESSKGFIVKTIAIVGGLAPVILMTVGLVGNGIANIMKFLSWIKAAFNKATTASQVLGETTDYMTQEQLKAASVAASLDQIHSKLRQTFTSEATAVEAYTAALKAANAAAGQFVGPVMPFRGGRKMATGGMVVGPGGPTDDLIPANLSNGEAVIPAASVKKNPGIISALFTGRKISVPRYSKGNAEQFAHVNENAKITTAQSVLDAILQAEAEGKKVSIKLKQLMQDIVTDLGPGFKVRASGGLGFGQAAALNVGMRGGKAVSTADFLSDFEARGTAKWNKAIKMGGGNLKDSELQAHLKQYDDAIVAGIKQFKKMSGGATITSDQFALIEAEARKTVPELSQLRKALDAAESGMYDVRANISQAVLSDAGIKTEQVPSSTGNGMSQKRVGRWSSGRYVRVSGNRAFASTPGIFGGIQLAELEDAGSQTVAGASEAVKNGAKRRAKIASPSKEMETVGEQLSEGAIVGLKSGEKDAEVAGAQVAKAVVAGASQSRTTVATSVRSGYVRDSELRDLTIRRKQAAMMGAETAAIDQEIKARKAAIASSVKERLAKERLASAEVQETQAAVQSGTVKKMMTVGDGLSKLNGKFMALSSGVTTAVFALSMLPGPIGQIAQAITPLLGIISLFGTGLELLNKRQVAVAASATAEAIATGAVAAEMTILSLPLLPLIAGITAVGLAIWGISAALQAATDAAKKKAAQDNAFANATRNVSGTFKELGGLTGTTLVGPTPYTPGAKTKKEASDIQTLLTSTEFTSKTSATGKMITNLKLMSNAAAETFLATYANQLKAAGMDSATIDSVIKALQIAAGKKTLKLEFANIDVSTKAGLDELDKNLSGLMSKIKPARGAAIAEKRSIKKDIDRRIKDQDVAGAFGTPGTPEYDKAKALAIKSLNDQLTKGNAILKSYRQSYGDVAKTVATDVSTITQEIANGQINQKGYNDAINMMQTYWNQLTPQQTKSAFAEYGQAASDAAGKLSGPIQQLQLLQALAAHAPEAAKAISLIAQGNIAGAEDLLGKFKVSDVVKNAKKYYTDTSNSAAGGGATKTDLIQQLKDAQNQSKARVALMNDDKKHVSGFIDLLATADEATRKVYMHIDKNGKVVLTGAGKKLEALFNASTVSNFVSKQKFAIKGFGEEAKARVFLSSKIKDQTVLTKMMEDADFKAAIASAMNIKDKKERTKALNDLIAVEQKYLKIQQSNADAALTEADKQQKRVDYLQAVLDKKTAESMMPVLQDKIDVYNDALNVLSVQEDEINKAYETRVTALDKIAQANQAIAQSQQDQLSVAEAITKGDMGAAAKAVQTMRANAAQKAMDDQKSALETAKEAQLKSLVVEVNGEKLTREEIEKRISGIQSTIYNIQLNQLDVIKSQIVEATRLQTILSANQTISDNTSYAPKTQTAPTKVVTAAYGQSVTIAAETDSKGKGTYHAGSFADGLAKFGYLGTSVLAGMGYYANGGFARGTDVVPAMLTPGEFIMSRGAVAKYGSGLMDKINAGTFDMPSYSVAPQISQVSPVSNTISSNVDNSSVYNNSYSVNIHTTGTQDTDSIARAVIGKIREYDSQRVRGVRV